MKDQDIVTIYLQKMEKEFVRDTMKDQDIIFAHQHR